MQEHDTTLEIIDVNRAKKYLSRNINNRPLRASLVRQYARDMKNGAWQTWGYDPIAFDKDGNLLNGQHRLSAIIIANVPVIMRVARDVPTETVFDLGAKRSISDMLAMNGDIPKELCTNLMLAAARILSGTVERHETASKHELSCFINEHLESFTEVNNELKFKHAAEGGCNQSAVLAAAIAAHINGVDIELLKRFMKIANSGLPDETSSRSSTAPLVLRKYLATSQNKTRSQQLNRFYVAKYCISKYEKGQSMSYIRKITETMRDLYPV